MYDRERRLTGRRRGTSPAPGVAGHLSRHPFRKQEEINNVRNAELNTTDVVEGLPGTAMMSASFPAKMLPFRSPTPQVLRRQLRPGRRGEDVGGDGRVRPEAWALLIPMVGKALTP